MPDPLPMWTVYDHPIDIPDRYVARLFHIYPGGSMATAEIKVADQLSVLRDEFMDMGLVRLDRSPDDDPKIVETWL